jgi:sporulation protein YlmC with PRC-barrel domain
MSQTKDAVMLRSIKQLCGYRIQATDGDIGKVYEFYFDDEVWTIRYLVVYIGGWLSGRLILIPRVALDQPDSAEHVLPVLLAKKQVESGPSIDMKKPVYRQRRSKLPSDWPLYWGGGRLLIAGAFDAYPYTKTKDKKPSIEDQEGDPHLRSTREVAGYRIQASDGMIGHVEDFILDDEAWAIRYIVVDTRNWMPGKKVLVSTQWAQEIRWSNYIVYVNLLRETIKNLPKFDPSSLVGRKQ